MSRTLNVEIEGLRRMTVTQLRAKHLELFGEECRSNHKDFLFKRIAWRMQAMAETAGPIIDQNKSAANVSRKKSGRNRETLHAVVTGNI